MAAGPIALYDKSFLQSLSLDESVWFDNFFLAVTCPVFFVETLADLEKAVRAGRTPEDEVGIIADKTPELQGGPCEHHAVLCRGSLFGHPVPMTGTIPMGGGKWSMTDGRPTVVMDEPSSVQAFQRWKARDFLAVEREFAAIWRATRKKVDGRAFEAATRMLVVDPKACRSTEDVYRAAMGIVRGPDQTSAIKLACLVAQFLGPEPEKQVFERWIAQGRPALTEFAPYAAHVLAVELFGMIAGAAGLIAGSDPSNRTDLLYLLYLPFCMVFVSSDKLHQRCAGHFLRPNQRFVWGPDLKADLARVNSHYAQLPEDEKATGVMSLAPIPPDLPGPITALWDYFWPDWRDRHRRKGEGDSAPSSAMQTAREIVAAAESEGGEVPPSDSEAEVFVLKRRVRRKKGSWFQVPKDIPDG